MNSTTETSTTAQAAAVAPKAAKATRKATAKKNAPTAANGAKKAGGKKAAAKPAAKKAAVPREFSKKQIVIDMLKAKGGATMAAIAKATDWQNHTHSGLHGWRDEEGRVHD